MRRVAAAGLDDRLQVLDVVAPERGGDFRFARFGPDAIPLDRIDLAVMRQHPEWMCQLPARKRVRAESLVVYSECSFVQRICQIEEELIQHRWNHQAFIDHGSAGKRGDVKWRYSGFDYLFFDFPADNVQGAFVLVRRQMNGFAQKNLPDIGLRRCSFVTQDRGIGGDNSPSKKSHLSFCNNGFNN